MIDNLSPDYLHDEADECYVRPASTLEFCAAWIVLCAPGALFWGAIVWAVLR